MPSLKDTKRRIGSVKNTQKITHAMKLVSAAKFARSNGAVIGARPYGAAFDQMVKRFMEQGVEGIESPLATLRPEKKSLMVVIATDRGLCGSLNSALFKKVSRWLLEKKAEGVDFDLLGWGRRADLFVKKQAYKMLPSREKVLEKPRYEMACELADELVHQFNHNGYDRIYIAYVEFKSAMSQIPTIEQLLPVGLKPSAANAKPDAKTNSSIIIIEPEVRVMFEGLLQRKIRRQIFGALLEGAASEHGARMTAMDQATKNAKEVIKKLTLQYNRARQAAITKELIEITSGADAL